MADVNRGNRPLSPFMLGQYYRPQIGSVTSILNRAAGVGLIVGALLCVWWLLAAASGPEYFGMVDWIVTSYLGDLVMFLSVWALWYHALAGVRHLIWDAGKCLELEKAQMLGKIVIGGSVVLTLLTAIIV
ncbi:succinate dehydrogenase, cytochrome b556 subunit [Mangrovicoccus sp. HB161399]|uniref:succinate dehydrogenase, cytochrome b556 subunit n=1 Tax=Mangrovicoccus sp. HB161399 TaxID=2720392 RepID=UPI0015545669|nr:succinate dehydrogenase, cytochrome b556 subunit [Mangrovicoccus sp. HB161399]